MPDIVDEMPAPKTRGRIQWGDYADGKIYRWSQDELEDSGYGSVKTAVASARYYCRTRGYEADISERPTEMFTRIWPKEEVDQDEDEDEPVTPPAKQRPRNEIADRRRGR